MKLAFILFQLICLTFSADVIYAQPTPVATVAYGETVQFGDLDEILERRIIRILVTYSKTDFFISNGELVGAQVELGRELLKHLNKGRTNRFHASETNKVIVQYVPVTFSELIPSLIAGKGDIATGFLTVTEEREQLVDFVNPGRRYINEILVSHKDAPRLAKLADLSGRELYLLRDSSYLTHIRELNLKLVAVGLPKVQVTVADEQLLTEDILELVNAGVIEHTICDDYKAELWAKVLPNLVLQNNIKVSEGQGVGWAIRKDSPQLEAALNNFSNKVKQGTLLGNIIFNKYYKNTQWIDNPVSRKERDKLAKLIHLFNKYGHQYRFEPLALAAQAYQESGLDHSAKSHRGAVGIMQLLPSTARDPNVNIPNIDSLENNIHAGTKYLDFLRNRYFSSPEISPLDQQLFTWAAYNAGPANIIRIRHAAEKEGLDPNRWFNHVEHMAAKMISREPVKYVANIYKYYTAYKLVEERQQRKTQALNEVIK